MLYFTTRFFTKAGFIAVVLCFILVPLVKRLFNDPGEIRRKLHHVNRATKILRNELLELVEDQEEPDDDGSSFNDYPYYFSIENQQILKDRAFLQFDKDRRLELNFSETGLMLSGPSEKYLQHIAKALAGDCHAKLLILDLAKFSEKISTKYGRSLLSSWGLLKHVQEWARDMWGDGQAGRMMCERQIYDPDTKLTGSPANSISRSFDKDMFIKALKSVIISLSRDSHAILYIKDVDKLIDSRPFMFEDLQQMLKSLEKPILVLGSKIEPYSTNAVEICLSLTPSLSASPLHVGKYEEVLLRLSIEVDHDAYRDAGEALQDVNGGKLLTNRDKLFIRLLTYSFCEKCGFFLLDYFNFCGRLLVN